MSSDPVTWLRVQAGAARRVAEVMARRPEVGVYKWQDVNPYQKLMYSAFTDGPSFAPLRKLYELKAFAALPASRRLLHLHWEVSYIWGQEGKKRDEHYVQMMHILRNWSDRGGRIAWTVHDANFFPPEEAERMAALTDLLSSISDLVHVHSDAARHHAITELGVPAEKVVVIRHPSYVTRPLGPTAGPRGFSAEKRSLLLFGMIKDYKNYSGLAAALEGLPREAFSRVVIAGSGSPELVPIERLRAVLPVTLDARYIPEQEVPQLFQTAGFLVLPYTLSLTSGAALLGCGFGVPVIAPSLGGIPESLPPENAPLLYDPSDPDGLRRALGRAANLTADTYAAMSLACHKWANDLRPHQQSENLRNAFADRGLIAR